MFSSIQDYFQARRCRTVRERLTDRTAQFVQPERLLVVLATAAIGGAELQTRTRLRGLSAHFDIVLLTHEAMRPLFHDLDLHVSYFESNGLRDPFDYSRRNCLDYARVIATTARESGASLIYAVMHNASLFLAIARWRHARALRGRRLVGSLHGSLLGYFAQQGRQPVWIERLLIRGVLKTLPFVITPSPSLSRELVEHFGARAERMVTIPNGFDLELIRRLGKESVPLDKEEPWVVTCCRLSEQKDFLTLLRGFARLGHHPTTRLIIVGEGIMQARIRVWASELGIDERVYCVGFEANPFKWMQRAEVFVLSSFYEGFGNVIVEAMALGTPVLASDCPWGPAEIIEPGQSGELFPITDDVALAEVLNRLLSDPEERAHLARGARDRADAFAARRMVGRYQALFQRLLGATDNDVGESPN